MATGDFCLDVDGNRRVDADGNYLLDAGNGCCSCCPGGNQCFVRWSTTWTCSGGSGTWSTPTAGTRACLPSTTDTSWQSVGSCQYLRWVAVTPTVTCAHTSPDCTGTTTATPAVPGFSPYCCPNILVSFAGMTLCTNPYFRSTSAHPECDGDDTEIDGYTDFADFDFDQSFCLSDDRCGVVDGNGCVWEFNVDVDGTFDSWTICEPSGGRIDGSTGPFATFTMQWISPGRYRVTVNVTGSQSNSPPCTVLGDFAFDSGEFDFDGTATVVLSNLQDPCNNDLDDFIDGSFSTCHPYISGGTVTLTPAGC